MVSEPEMVNLESMEERRRERDKRQSLAAAGVLSNMFDLFWW